MLRHLLGFLLLALTTAASAGSWTDEFESMGSNWSLSPEGIPPAFSNQLNHTPIQSADQSFYLSNNGDAPTSASRDTEAFSTGDEANGILSIWFYDDGTPVTGFRVGTQEGYGAIGTSDMLALGVSDTTTSLVNQYALFSNTATTLTGVTRTPGWHLAEFSITASGTTAYLDGIAFPGNTSSQNTISALAFIDTSSTGTGVNAANRLWVDSASFNSWTTVAASQGTGDWTDDFESGISPFYKRGYFSDPRTTTTVNHTPEPGAQYSHYIATGFGTEGTVRITEIATEAPQPATLGFWFYDELKNPTSYLLGVNTSYPVSPGFLSGKRVGFTLAGPAFIDTQHYHFSINGSPQSTGILRTQGWHYASFTITPEGLDARIDNMSFEGHLVPEVNRICEMVLLNTDPSANAGYMYVDDISYQRNQGPPPAAVSDWAATWSLLE